MTKDSENELHAAVAAVRGEVDGVTSLLVTVLVSIGVLAFGFALGVRYAAVRTLNELAAAGDGPTQLYGPLLAPVYNNAMQAGLAFAAIGLLAAVAVDRRTTASDTTNADG